MTNHDFLEIQKNHDFLEIRKNLDFLEIRTNLDFWKIREFRIRRFFQVFRMPEKPECLNT